VLNNVNSKDVLNTVHCLFEIQLQGLKNSSNLVGFIGFLGIAFFSFWFYNRYILYNVDDYCDVGCCPLVYNLPHPQIC